MNGLAEGLMKLHTPIWLVAICKRNWQRDQHHHYFYSCDCRHVLFLSFLEDSGYMARAAFVVDRIMQKLGLPGKSFR